VAVLSGTEVETIFSGTPLIDPVGVTFGPGDKLYVANSSSWISPFQATGTILALESNGTFSTFCADSRLWGPGWVAFGVSSDGGFPPAYMGTEDSVEYAGRGSDEILLQDGATVTDGPDIFEPGKLLYVTSGPFQPGLYISARSSSVPGGQPNPTALLHWDPSAGQPAVVPITTTAGDLQGVQGFTFGNGGALGHDLYVSTLLDPGYSPDASVGVWRVDAGLDAVAFNQGLEIIDLAASPDPNGSWGDYLYGNGVDIDAGPVLVRIALDGGVQQLATGLQSYGSVSFSGDGGLYFTDIKGHAIYRLSPCAP
jgi:hypothetical protein